MNKIIEDLELLYVCSIVFDFLFICFICLIMIRDIHKSMFISIISNVFIFINKLILNKIVDSKGE